VTVEATSAAGAVVEYTATATDNLDPAPVVACAPATNTRFAIGNTVVSCRATDRIGNETTASFVIAVRDTTAPLIDSASPSVTSIWPPDKRMVPVSIAVAASDIVDGVPACNVTAVASNEPSTGSWSIVDPLTVNVKADRNGNGSGRVYAITVRCTDAAGNASTSTVHVTVPHDQGRN